MSAERSSATETPLRIVVLTTSYPRYPGDYAGTFVAAAVGHLRERGHEVEVVSPQDFRHFGIAYGHGVIGNLRRRPWLLLLLPLMLLNFRRAARRAARGADLIHAYWLPSGAVALGLGPALVLQLPGSDILLARKLSLLSRPILRRAGAVICPSNELAEEARRLGARASSGDLAGVRGSGRRRARRESRRRCCSPGGSRRRRASSSWSRRPGA